MRLLASSCWLNWAATRSINLSTLPSTLPFFWADPPAFDVCCTSAFLFPILPLY